MQLSRVTDTRCIVRLILANPSNLPIKYAWRPYARCFYEVPGLSGFSPVGIKPLAPNVTRRTIHSGPSTLRTSAVKQAVSSQFKVLTRFSLTLPRSRSSGEHRPRLRLFKGWRRSDVAQLNIKNGQFWGESRALRSAIRL
ncbi:hypothetical protein CC80DRAFT_556164 [Byssothecium circinans]|uniref:Uncharacterized protein n=1 Tax=Byssothecium circinans TaxID=147558 RepID=A0A6A5T8W2_9PLEO|nr:hypothetical protein CC80DRAFT_556307 [Byssothecium circinans]KAF1948594.1 hypothetical protein CC80DRAFT_556164 [Byssothecium circinans]